jgi:hypothetical protein
MYYQKELDGSCSCTITVHLSGSTEEVKKVTQDVKDIFDREYDRLKVGISLDISYGMRDKPWFAHE